MGSSFNYVTKEGDRIDSLAHRYYGGMYGISILADVNVYVPLEAVFPIGTVLIVPYIDFTETTNNSLPPWKRNTP